MGTHQAPPRCRRNDVSDCHRWCLNIFRRQTTPYSEVQKTIPQQEITPLTLHSSWPGSSVGSECRSAFLCRQSFGTLSSGNLSRVDFSCALRIGSREPARRSTLLGCIMLPIWARHRGCFAHLQPCNYLLALHSRASAHAHMCPSYPRVTLLLPHLPLPMLVLCCGWQVAANETKHLDTIGVRYTGFAFARGWDPSHMGPARPAPAAPSTSSMGCG